MENPFATENDVLTREAEEIAREEGEIRKLFLKQRYDTISKGGTTLWRKVKLKETIAEVYNLKDRVDSLERINSRLREAYRERGDTISSLEKKIKSLEPPEEKEPTVLDDLSDDSDEEDEYVEVQGITYLLIVDEDVVDIKTGLVVGQMKGGKVVFNTRGTKKHKQNVKSLEKKKKEKKKT